MFKATKLKFQNSQIVLNFIIKTLGIVASAIRLGFRISNLELFHIYTATYLKT